MRYRSGNARLLPAGQASPPLLPGPLPHLSVIIPASDASYTRRLASSLPAIRAQPTAGEIILVWMSKDPAPADLLRLCRKHDVWVIPAQPDKGPFCLSRARNIGGQRASCEGLAFVDADVILDPDLLATAAHELSRGDAFVTALTCTMKEGQHPGEHLLRPGPFSKFAGTLPVVACGFGGFLAVKREHYREIGGYDEKFVGWSSEDNDFVDRLVWWDLEHINLSEKYGLVAVHQWHPRTNYEATDHHANRERYWSGCTIARNPDGCGRIKLRRAGDGL